MDTSSLLGGGEATEQHNPPCLHRVEDGHLSGLPFICTLDKGHVGEHAEELTAEPMKAAGEFHLWTGRTDEDDVYLTACARRPDGDIETRGLIVDLVAARAWIEANR